VDPAARTVASRTVQTDRLGLRTGAGLGVAGSLLTAGVLHHLIFSWPASRAADGFESDLLTHFTMLHTVLHDSPWAYSAFYYLLRAVTVGTSDPQLLIQAGFLVLGMIAVLKGVMTAGLLLNEGYRPVGAAAVATMLGTALALPLPVWMDHFYLGTFPPNTLGSATQPLANAMAILAAWGLCAWYERPDRRATLLLGLTGAASALAKPALTPAWLAVVGVLAIVMWRRDRGGRRLLGVAAAMALPTATLGVGFLLTFGDGAARRVRFREWSEFSTSLPIDLLRSWAFPIAVIVALAVTRRGSGAVRYLVPAWLMLLVGILQSQLLMDTDPSGVPIGYGDMNWGAVAATSGLYAVSAMALLRTSPRARLVPFGVLGVQTAAALVHLHHWVRTGSYF
jgi:hypothetical protein